MKSCGKWYLGCSCKFGKRYGSPCTHMFHVFNEYLKDIGVVEWCYKDVSFIHWSLYSYVYATMGNTDSTLTQDELSWLDYFNKNDPTGYADVKCVFDIDSQLIPKTNEDMIELLKNKVVDFGDTVSPKKWSCLPAKARVSNYTATEVILCLDEMNKKSSDVLNASKFEFELSQDDGWEDFGDIFDHSQKSSNSPDFEGMLQETAMDCETSRDSRKSSLLKNFYDVMKTTNLKDDLQFNMCRRYLIDLKGKLRDLNEVGAAGCSEDDQLIQFPNGSTGDNCRDSITKRNK